MMEFKSGPISSAVRDAGPADRCLRDVVALSTLPAMWLGAEPLRVAESLAASLFTTLDPEFVYVSFTDVSGKPPIAVVQTDRYGVSSRIADRIGAPILEWARTHDPDDLLMLPDPVGSGFLRVAVRPLGAYAELGVIAAAFADDNLPTSVHRLIFNVSASQASTAVQSARLVRSLRDSEERNRLANADLARHVADLEKANLEIQDARRAALNLMEDAVQSRNRIEILNQELRREIAERTQAESLLATEKKVLELIATGWPLPDVLDTLMRETGAQSTDGMLCSVLLADEKGQRLLHGSAPSLPDAYNEAIHDIAIGPKAGSCGTAAFERKPVSVTDIAGDPRWADLKDLAATHGLGACHSTPILSSQGQLLGTIAMYYRRPHNPGAHDRRLIERATQLAGIAIERDRANEARQRDLEDARRLQEISAQLIQEDNVQALYERILDAAVAIMRSDFASIQMLYPERMEGKGELLLLAHRGFTREGAEAWKWVGTDSYCICGETLRSGERVVVNDFETCEFMAGTPGLETYRTVGIRAAQSTLLRSRAGKVLGLISTHWRDPHRPSEREWRLLDVLARLAADVIERSQVERSIRESAERFRALINATSDVIYRMSPDWTEMRHLQGREFIVDTLEPSQTWLNKYIHPEDQRHVMDTIQGAIQSKSVFELEHRVIRVDGSLGWTYSRAIPILDDAGEIVEWFGAAGDVTQRKEAEEALRRLNDELEQRVTSRTQELVQSQNRLRALATELNLAEQRERKRLAMELHDHLQQMLVLGKLTIGQGKRVAAGVPACEQVLKKVDDIFSDALTYTRTLVSDLSPTVLHEHGLAAALRWLGAYMKKHNQTVTVTVLDDGDLKLPEDQVILLFQSVRELLINSSKHAGTGEATVRMEQRDGLLRIGVRDEGAGFDLAAAVAAAGEGPNGSISSKFGLFSIRERMRALGGSFDLQSAAGQGTIATLVLPLARHREDKATVQAERRKQIFPQP